MAGLFAGDSTVSFLDSLKSGWGARFNGALTRTGFDTVNDFPDATDDLLREYLQPELRRDGARPLEIHRIIKAIAAFGADPSQPLKTPQNSAAPEKRLVKFGCGCQVYVSCGQPGHDSAWRSCAMCNESAADGAVFVESVTNGPPVCLRCVELPMTAPVSSVLPGSKSIPQGTPQAPVRFTSLAAPTGSLHVGGSTAGATGAAPPLGAPGASSLPGVSAAPGVPAAHGASGFSAVSSTARSQGGQFLSEDFSDTQTIPTSMSLGSS